MYKIRKFVYHIRKISNTLMKVSHFEYWVRKYIQLHNITVDGDTVVRYIDKWHGCKRFDNNILIIKIGGYIIKINGVGLSIASIYSNKHVIIINMNGEKLPL